MTLGTDISASLRARRGWAQETLCRLIGYSSTTGNEGEVQAHIAELLTGLGLPFEAVPIPESILGDPDYTIVPGHAGYQDRPNLIVNLKGSGEGGVASVIINTHVDVVPGPAELFTARVEGGTIFGRGACDAKGQVVTILLALAALKDLGLYFHKDVQAQFVIEEEAGGNGSLAAILGAGLTGHVFAVVLEPTSLRARSANRGAVWFRLAVEGRTVHMGRAREGVSAVDEMAGLLPILKEYEGLLRAASKGQPGFPDDPSPVVVNVGRIRGGDWPSTVPGECVVEGGIAFLPNRSIPAIMDELRGLLDAKAGAWARAHYRLETAGLHNEAFATNPDHPAVQLFRRIAGSVVGPQGLGGWEASCDARLFLHRGRMPTIVFGAGDLGHAHSLVEQVRIDDVLSAAETVLRYLVSSCGVAHWEGEHGR